MSKAGLRLAFKGREVTITSSGNYIRIRLQDHKFLAVMEIPKQMLSEAEMQYLPTTVSQHVCI